MIAGVGVEEHTDLILQELRRKRVETKQKNNNDCAVRWGLMLVHPWLWCGWLGEVRCEEGRVRERDCEEGAEGEW